MSKSVGFYKDNIIPNTVTAEMATIERAILLFLSCFFSAFNLDSKSVNFTLPLILLSLDWS